MPGIRTVQSSGFQHSAKGTWQLSALLLTEVTLGHRRKVTTQMSLRAKRQPGPGITACLVWNLKLL